jgi:hypothetical protein
MTKEDFMSISAVRSPELQDLFRRAIDGEVSKSYFVEAYGKTPHAGRGRNARKHRHPKTAMYHADLLERYFGWIWNC